MREMATILSPSSSGPIIPLLLTAVWKAAGMVRPRPLLILVSPFLSRSGRAAYAVKSKPLPTSLTASSNSCSSRRMPPTKKHIPRHRSCVAKIEPKIAA